MLHQVSKADTSMRIIHLFVVMVNLIVHSNAQCEWRGRAPICSPSYCKPDEFIVEESSTSDSSDFGRSCFVGTKKFCCQLKKCYFAGYGPSCGSPSCLVGDAQFGTTTYNSGATCWSGVKTFCCPGFQRQRVKATFYENSDREGSEESYDEESYCINLKQPETANSVDNHNTCVRVFDKVNCEGNSIALWPTSPDHNLTKLGFEHGIKSVAPCLNGDHLRGFYKQHRDPKLLERNVTFGYNPHLKLDEENLTGPVLYYQTGHGGRTESMQAEISRRHLCKTTSTCEGSRNYVRRFGGEDDDVGLILGSRLGGSGNDRRNLFPKNSHVNWVDLDSIEQMVGDLVVVHGVVKYNMNLVYEGLSTVPYRILVRIQFFDSENNTPYVITDDFVNP